MKGFFSSIIQLIGNRARKAPLEKGSSWMHLKNSLKLPFHRLILYLCQALIKTANHKMVKSLAQRTKGQIIPHLVEVRNVKYLSNLFSIELNFIN